MYKNGKILIGKNEAMRKIELDEDLEEDFKKSKSKKGNHISKKKISKQKSDGFALKKNSKKFTLFHLEYQGIFLQSISYFDQFYTFYIRK